jgi:hypothetical protein
LNKCVGLQDRLFGKLESVQRSVVHGPEKTIAGLDYFFFFLRRLSGSWIGPLGTVGVDITGAPTGFWGSFGGFGFVTIIGRIGRETIGNLPFRKRT